MQQAATAPFPRLPLIGAIAVVCVAIIGVAVARLSGIPASSGFFEGSPVASRMLIFLDEADGSISVRDADSGEHVARVAPGTNGFLRGALRGMGRARKRDGGDRMSPFILQRWPNGHLTLEDPVNGIRIDFFAFGPTNAQVFSAFLPKATGEAP